LIPSCNQKDTEDRLTTKEHKNTWRSEAAAKRKKTAKDAKTDSFVSFAIFAVE